MEEPRDVSMPGVTQIEGSDLDAETIALMRDVLRDVKEASEKLAAAAISASDLLTSTGAMPAVSSVVVPTNASEPMSPEFAAPQPETPAARAQVYFTTTISNIPPATPTPCPPEAAEPPRPMYFPDKPVDIENARDFATLAELPKERMPRVPFVLFVIAGAVLAGFASWAVFQVPVGTSMLESQYYSATLLAAAALVALGLLMVLPVWLVARTEVSERPGLFTRVFFRSSLCTALVVLLWVGALVLSDLIRLDRLSL